MNINFKGVTSINNFKDESYQNVDSYLHKAKINTN